MNFSRVEDFFQQKLNKLLRIKKGGLLEPDDLKARFKDELVRYRKLSDDGFVPNVYEFDMSPEDSHRLSSHRVIDDLYLFAEQSIILTDSFIDGELKLRFCQDENLPNGSCQTRVFSETPQETIEDKDFRTIILNRSVFSAETPPAYNKEFASLTVTAGAEKDFVVEFGREKVTIGRSEENDVILSDRKISRQHCYVQFDNYRHILYDAGSTNGTFVNEEQTKEVPLLNGDKIRIGDTVLTYEIL